MVKINPQKLYSKRQNEIVKSVELDYQDDLIKLDQKANFKINNNRIDKNRFLISIQTKLSPILNCDRCLKEFNKDYQVKVEQVYAITPEENEMKIESDGQIDIFKPIIDQLISKIPAKKLCSLNCKGICQICGQDLNEQICDCQKESIGHPEFQKLKKLKNKK